MQNTGQSSRRWLQGLGAAMLLLALTAPASATHRTCASIGGTFISPTCTLSGVHNLAADAGQDVALSDALIEDLVIAAGGELRYGDMTGTLSVTGALTVDAGGSITANGGGGQNGGNVTITVSGDAVVDGSITATGGSGTGGPSGSPAGTGGTLALIIGGDLTVNAGGSITANGGDTGPAQNAGGAGGTVTITADSTTVEGTVAANGANPPAPPALPLGVAPGLSGEATLYVELLNSDDIGTNFDVIAQILANGKVIASGLTRCVTGVPRSFPSAKMVTVPLSDPPPPDLTLRIFARIGTNPDGTKCAGHNGAAGLRLHYDGATNASQAAGFYLHSNGSTCTAAGSTGVTTRTADETAPITTSFKCQDSAGVNFAGGNIPRQIGGDWTLTFH